MNYSVMFTTPDSETVFCAVSGIESEHDAYKILTWFSNNPYSANRYFVQIENGE